jgi:O-antigen/teichoic acid export membrane protein
MTAAKFFRNAWPKIASSGANGGSDYTARSGERHRRAMLTALTAAAARAMRIGVSLIAVPLTLHYLGAERFGLWMTISSVLAMANFADFGIGNGVLNTVAGASGREDLKEIRHAISSGFAVLVAIGAVSLAGFFSVYRFVSWGNLFRATSPHARAEAGPAMAIFFLCFAINIPFDVVQRVQLGLQEGYRTNAWQVGASVLTLIGILVATHFQLGLPALVAVFAGAPVLGVGMNMVHFFGFSHRELVPHWRFVSGRMILQIAKLGGLFFVLQLVSALSFSADNFIIARTLSVASVTLFAIPQRIFALIELIVGFLMTPFWPAYAEALSRGDMSWIRITLVRTLVGVFVFATIAAAILLFSSERIIFWWVGPQIRPPYLLLVGLAIWSIMSSCGMTLAMFLNGAGVVKFQVITASLFGVACVATKILFARHYGITGVPWATIVTYGCFIVLPSFLYVPALTRRITATRQPALSEESIAAAVEDYRL